MISCPKKLILLNNSRPTTEKRCIIGICKFNFDFICASFVMLNFPENNRQRCFKIQIIEEESDEWRDEGMGGWEEG